MVIHKYIIHVLDRNSEAPILNDFEGTSSKRYGRINRKVKINCGGS